MTIQGLLAEGKKLLKAPCLTAFIDTPALDAALLLADTLQVRREELIARPDDAVSGPDSEKYRALLERRRSGECVAYILGRKEFRGLDFSVNPKVLVPRPDTETLFEAALGFIDTLNQNLSTENGGSSFSVLDLCTGSGALAVSLKKERPFISVTASDVSAPALETAALNASRLLPGEFAIRFIHCRLFESIKERFDIIISNPPYIPSGELPKLAPEVQKEPTIALDGGEDGLALVRLIVTGAPEHLLPGGALLLEADPAQMQQIKTLMEDNGFTQVRLHRNLAGKNRVISGKVFTQ